MTDEPRLDPNQAWAHAKTPTKFPLRHRAAMFVGAAIAEGIYLLALVIEVAGDGIEKIDDRIEAWRKGR